MSVWDDVVADWFARVLPPITPRRKRTRGLPGKADALIGMRRSGKTWTLLGEIAAARAAGAPGWAQLYVSLEDERLFGVGPEALGGVLDAWWRRFPEAATGPAWLALDEVQVVPGWERFVRRLLDEGRLRLSVTGSSARLLSREIATTLRGRSLSTEVLPFGFDEWLTHRGHPVPARWPPTTAEQAGLANALDTYLEVGGFPEVGGLSLPDRRDVLRDYVDVVLLRDVVERHGDANVPALRRLVRRFVSTPGSAFSVHKLHQDLRSQGVAIGKDALYAYVDHVEDAFLGFRVPIRTTSERVRATNPTKLYPVDPGLARAFATRPEVGRLLEAAVYLELRRRGGDVTWHRTPRGHEVDFVVDGDAGPALVQVCADPTDDGTRAREVRALDEAMAELDVREATVVTLEARRRVEQRPAGVVAWVPAWEWLLRP
jgi:predicted AAA+ superfamily ATPase